MNPKTQHQLRRLLGEYAPRTTSVFISHGRDSRLEEISRELSAALKDYPFLPPDGCVVRAGGVSLSALPLERPSAASPPAVTTDLGVFLALLDEESASSSPSPCAHFIVAGKRRKGDASIAEAWTDHRGWARLNGLPSDEQIVLTVRPEPAAEAIPRAAVAKPAPHILAYLAGPTVAYAAGTSHFEPRRLLEGNQGIDATMRSDEADGIVVDFASTEAKNNGARIHFRLGAGEHTVTLHPIPGCWSARHCTGLSAEEAASVSFELLDVTPPAR